MGNLTPTRGCARKADRPMMPMVRYTMNHPQYVRQISSFSLAFVPLNFRRLVHRARGSMVGPIGTLNCGRAPTTNRPMLPMLPEITSIISSMLAVFHPSRSYPYLRTSDPYLPSPYLRTLGTAVPPYQKIPHLQVPIEVTPAPAERILNSVCGLLRKTKLFGFLEITVLHRHAEARRVAVNNP